MMKVSFPHTDLLIEHLAQEQKCPAYYLIMVAEL